MCLTDGYGGCESLSGAPEDVRDEAHLAADRQEHADCESCAWMGVDTRVCLAGHLPADERLCGGDVATGTMVDGVPCCAACAACPPVLVEMWELLPC